MEDTSAVDTLVSSLFTDLTTTLTGTLVPAFFGLVILGAVIALGVKYLRKGASKA